MHLVYTKLACFIDSEKLVPWQQALATHREKPFRPTEVHYPVYPSLNCQAPKRIIIGLIPREHLRGNPIFNLVASLLGEIHVYDASIHGVLCFSRVFVSLISIFFSLVEITIFGLWGWIYPNFRVQSRKS